MPIPVGSGGLTLTVESDKTGTAFGGTATFTDDSGYLLAGRGFEPVTVTWGRQDQLSTVSPTTVSRTLMDSDGRFTPGLATGANYPHWRRGVRGRVTATVGATTVNLADDYADTLTVAGDKDLPTTCTQGGTDILGRFGGQASSLPGDVGVPGMQLRSFLAEEMLLDSPVALWMLQEAEGATAFADVTGVQAPATVESSSAGPGSVDAAQAGSGSWVAGNVVAVTNSDYATWTSGASPGSWLSLPNPAWQTFEAWVLATGEPPAVAATLVAFTAPGAFGSFDIAVLADGTMQVRGISFGSITVSAQSAAGVFPFDGGIHQVVLALDTHLYLDGKSVATHSALGPNAAGTTRLGVGLDTAVNPAYPFEGGYAFTAFYSGTLSPTRVLAHYNAGANAFAGERTDTRISRLLSYRPDTGSVLDTGLGFMGQQDIDGTSLQQALFDVAAVEGGVVFIDGQGRVNFRSRSRLFNPTPAVTLDCSLGCVDWPSQWREDTQGLVNDVTVTRNGGADNRYYDPASVAADGVYSTTLTLDIDSDDNARNMAGWIVANGKQQQLTVTPLQVDLSQLSVLQPAVATAVLQLQPLDCARLTNCPAWAPATSMSVIVQGGELSFAVAGSDASLNSTPMPPAVAVWDSTVWDSTPVWAP